MVILQFFYHSLSNFAFDTIFFEKISKVIVFYLDNRVNIWNFDIDCGPVLIT